MSVSGTLSSWAQETAPSPTLAVKYVADALRSEGHILCDFGIGEMNPEIPAPEIIKTTIASAAMAEQNYYTAAQGDANLLQAIAEDLRINFDIPTALEELCVFSGPKDAIFKAAMAMANGRAHRRRFICFGPTYEAFVNIPRLVSGEASIVIETDSKTFLPDPADLRKVLQENDDVACVIINSPNNPTGAVYPMALLSALADVLRDFPQVWALSDEVYRTVRYDQSIRHASIRQVLPEQTVSVAGMSKEVSGTGLRLGFIAGPARIISLIRDIQGNTSSCVNLPTQRAYEALLRHDCEHDMELRAGILEQLSLRRERLRAAFAAAVERWPAVGEAVFGPLPEGAFYWFPSVEGVLEACRRNGAKTLEGKPIAGDSDLAVHLLKAAGVVTLPGSNFGRPGHLRMAYCLPLETIDRGITSMCATFADLLGKEQQQQKQQ
ncbi:unnamed protein product [Polarella glacialis]|uniref:Aminotransferase class I/classII large domain-containing protein n=1 Tax=Polarella glacialis TaxID=89957 RepID=A0A813HYA9_POLGL|nr:unnamed protein product [Polarella glacialis]